MRGLLLAVMCILMAGCTMPSSGGDVDRQAESKLGADDVVPSASVSPGTVGTGAATTGTGADLCVDAQQARRLYDDAQSFFERLPEEDVSLRIEGTVEGEIWSVLMQIDPADEAFAMSGRMDGEEMDAKYRDGYYWVDFEGEVAYGRDLDPEVGYTMFTSDVFGKDDTPSFADDLQFEDYEVECTTLSGVETVRFRYDDGEVVDELVVEREGGQRPLSGRIIDPMLQDNFRVSMSYDPVRITLDTQAPRAPITVEFELVDQYGSDEGLVTKVRIGANTEWASLRELELWVVGADDYDMGQLYNAYMLEAGTYELDEGYFEYVDLDGNGLLSANDTLEVGVAHGYDWNLYDDWASTQADWSYA